MIPKVTLMDLWKITIRRSTLITIPNLIEFFKFNNEVSEWEVFYGIVRDALDKFQYYYPLFRQQRVYLVVNGTTHTAEIDDNFNAYLDGIINEDQITLMPSAVIGLAATSTVQSSYPLRDFHYEVGKFTDIWYPTGYWWMSLLANYPFPEDFDAKGYPTDRCAVYYMHKDRDSRFKILKDQVYVEYCRYISNMKQNMQLSNLPIEVFAGLESDSQRVQGELERLYDSALNSASWIM